MCVRPLQELKAQEIESKIDIHSHEIRVKEEQLQATKSQLDNVQMSLEEAQAEQARLNNLVMVRDSEESSEHDEESYHGKFALVCYSMADFLSFYK